MPDTKDTTLTKAEQKRLEHFNKISDSLISEGYTRKNLTIDLKRANKAGLIFTITLIVIAAGLFYLVNPEVGPIIPMSDLSIFLVAIIVLTVVHEGIHGIFWAILCPNGFKSIEFGVLRKSMTPYCACLTPLKKSSYIIGAVMPLMLLGVIPLIAAYPLASTLLLYIGVVMTTAATGDIMIIANVLKHKQSKPEMLIYDHPTEGGSVVFER